MMKRFVSYLLFLTLSGLCVSGGLAAQEYKVSPVYFDWEDDKDVMVYFQDGTASVYNTRKGKFEKAECQSSSERQNTPTINGAHNITYSPDKSKIAYTRDHNLYVADAETFVETQLTFDGSDVILNGYASWVYFEEIFGRHTAYKAFWWAPDGEKLLFYRFDNSQVPVCYLSDDPVNPSYSYQMRYPKAGETNPTVKIGVVSVGGGDVVWADFNENEDQYFGTPFWAPDSNSYYIPRMPRLQNTLDLYCVAARNGSKTHIYNEKVSTWLEWISEVIFTDKGLYMSRDFATGWQQIYFLSYDGKDFRCLTSGSNWNLRLVKVDEQKGKVYFTACRDASMRSALYVVDNKGIIKALTDPSYNVFLAGVSPDGKNFVAQLSNVRTPDFLVCGPTCKGVVSKGRSDDSLVVDYPADAFTYKTIYDVKGPDYDECKYALGQLVYMKTPDGFTLPGMIVYPKNFDSSKQYPVHVDIYGGPDTPMVRDRWRSPSNASQWWSENGIIEIVVDPRSAGHNGRKGLDMIYRQLTVWELQDYVSWADWLKSLPYVNPDKIGIEGFSYGGTMTAMLLLKASDSYHYGVAGGGVYDWRYYDSHYTERFMDTPQNNPEGYDVSSVIKSVSSYPVVYSSESVDSVEPVLLKLTHGTSDDNVHFINTLHLVDAMQKEGKKFELMLYPYGMHGYRDYQGRHDTAATNEFWLKCLKSN